MIGKVAVGFIVFNDAVQILNYAVRNTDELNTTSYYVAETLRGMVDSVRSGEAQRKINHFKESFKNNK